MAGVVAECVADAADELVAVLDDEKIFARRLAASLAKSLRNAAFTIGDLDPDEPAVVEETELDENPLLAAAMNFWWSLSAEGGRTRLDGIFRKVCFGGTSRGGDGLRFPELDSGSSMLLDVSSLL